MKKNLSNLLLGGVLLFSLSMCLTSCEGALDDVLGEWSRPTPGSSTGGGGTETSISITPTTLALTAGETGQLTATVIPAGTAVTWSSDQEAVATVDANGLVTAKAEGTATITAKAGDKSATCTVTVTEVYTANDYKEGSWDNTNKKVVFTKKTASATEITNTYAGGIVSGWYTVTGDNVSITGVQTLTADVHIILCDGAKLTINGQLNGYSGGYNLYIYGQGKGDGKLIVTNNGDAIMGLNTADADKVIEIHGGEITANATNTSYGAGLMASGIKVYGGKLTAESKGSYGIQFGNSSGSGYFNVYGGEVEGTSLDGSEPEHGIAGTDPANEILTVYGGKVTGNASEGGHGFECKLLSGTEGIKFHFKTSTTDWDAGTNYPTATASPTNRYAKAEKAASE